MCYFRPCAFDILSDEVVLQILSYLSRGSLVTMARTCKRLRAISYDETLWARVDLANKWLGPGVVGAVVSRGTQVLRMAKTRVESPIFQPSAILFNRYLNIHCIVQLICSEFSNFNSKFIQEKNLVIHTIISN